MLKLLRKAKRGSVQNSHEAMADLGAQLLHYNLRTRSSNANDSVLKETTESVFSPGQMYRRRELHADSPPGYHRANSTRFFLRVLSTFTDNSAWALWHPTVRLHLKTQGAGLWLFESASLECF